MKVRAALLAAALLLAGAGPAAAAVPGERTLHFSYGPIEVRPGQNTIVLEPNELKPDVPGWITGFRPDLVRADGTVPRVDVIHLHHGVWLKDFAPLFASGEEKTAVDPPDGFGWRHAPDDPWQMNHMIHNLTPVPDEVFIEYELDFVPLTAPGAAGMRDVETVWMDTVGGAYPVFDVRRGAGRGGRFEYPDDAPGVARRTWTAPADGALVHAYGHLHPGGLWTDLTVTRGGRTVPLFRSRARYYEPAGAVSWDVSMTVTPPRWRVALKQGDVVSVSATYDTRRASWYESMGIMPLAWSPGAAGTDPFSADVAVRGRVTHGHLRENDRHGGGPTGLPDPREALARPIGAAARIGIGGFLYGRGDLRAAGPLPSVRAGQGLTFVNRDASQDIFHTVTACRAPCTGATGIAYPLADGRVDFDSGELGFGPEGFTAAANRVTWTTPRSLRPGTYTYFCRVHPFMRGAFRVGGAA